jgi:hypothetical protein
MNRAPTDTDHGRVFLTIVWLSPASPGPTPDPVYTPSQDYGKYDFFVFIDKLLVNKYEGQGYTMPIAKSGL